MEVWQFLTYQIIKTFDSGLLISILLGNRKRYCQRHCRRIVSVGCPRTKIDTYRETHAAIDSIVFGLRTCRAGKSIARHYYFVIDASCYYCFVKFTTMWSHRPPSTADSTRGRIEFTTRTQRCWFLRIITII